MTACTPRHDPAGFDRLSRFVFTCHNATLECVARSFTAEVVRGPLGPGRGRRDRRPPIRGVTKPIELAGELGGILGGNRVALEVSAIRVSKQLKTGCRVADPTGAAMRRSLLLALTVSLLAAAPAGANPFLPPAGKVWHGVAGGYSPDSFARETGREPEVFQLFAEWGNVDWTFARADASGARMMVHLSTNKGPGTRERITPAQIAAGRGDAFLVRFGERIAERGKPFYLRLMAEMNGPWNAYCAFDANGRARPGHSTRQFRRAWRRIALVLRGGDRAAVNAKLRRLRMPALTAGGDELAKAPVALMWVPHNATALNTRANQPRAYWPGGKYVDWVGTDFYGQNPNWGALEKIYRDFPGKPFVFGEWALWGRDDPGFVRRIFAFARSHRRVRMLVYNQGVRENGPFRLKRYPRAKRALRAALRRAP